MKNKELLKSYLGIGGLLVSVSQASGQVVYHDFIPDTSIVAPNTCSNIYFDLDLNTDGITDFQFEARKCIPSPGTTYGCQGEFIMMMAGGLNQIIPDYYGCIANATYSSNNCQAKKLSPGYIIGNTANFNNCGELRQWSYCNFQNWLTDCGTWNSGDSASIGLKFNIGGLYHFGWVRIKMLSKSSCKILDYAYQLIPGAPVAASMNIDLTTNIPELSNYFTFAVEQNKVIVSSAKQFQNLNVIVTDLPGRTITKNVIHESKSEWYFDKPGIYFFHLEGEGINVRRKVFIY